MELEKILTESDPVAAGDRTEVEIGLTNRIGIDGISVTETQIAADGNLRLNLSSGAVIDAGRALGQSGVHGLADFDTEPEYSPDSRVYIGSGRGTYTNFIGRNGEPIRVEKDNTLVLLHAKGGESVWEPVEMEIELSDYQPRNTFTLLTTAMPAFTSYPYDVAPLTDCYDEAAGTFALPEGRPTITSQDDFFGKIVYRDCRYILVGFSMEYMFYLETETGRCMLMATGSKEMKYHEMPFAETGTTLPLVRVDTHNESSRTITIEQSENGVDYYPYAVVGLSDRYLYPIHYRRIGFYRPEGAPEPKILSVGNMNRLAVEGVPVEKAVNREEFEVLSPADNMAGVTRQTISLKGVRRRNETAVFGTAMPPMTCYPYTANVMECYDEATGKFSFPLGMRTITSLTARSGKVVYRNCRYILLGFNMSNMVYLETQTGRCAMMATDTKELWYPDTPVSDGPMAGDYVRVTTDEQADTVLVEESADGSDFSVYAEIHRDRWYGNRVEHLCFGFYQPEDAGDPEILSLGTSERLDLENVVRIDGDTPERFEVLVPSANTAGIAVRTVTLEKNEEPGKPFAGKKIALFGDSITAEHGVEEGTYTGMIREKTGAAEVEKHGYSGGRIGSVEEGRIDTICTPAYMDAILAGEPDYVFILAGTNDYWYNVPIGDIHAELNDFSDLNPTSGGLRYIFDYLLCRMNRSSRILFCTPPPGIWGPTPDTTPNGIGLRMTDYVEAMKQVCSEYHVPLCDTWSLAGWYPPAEAIAFHYTTDGVHLSEAGYDRVTDLMVSEAEWLFI